MSNLSLDDVDDNVDDDVDGVNDGVDDVDMSYGSDVADKLPLDLRRNLGLLLATFKVVCLSFDRLYHPIDVLAL